MQAFKEKFNPKVKKNPIPHGMLFTQILRQDKVDVSSMEPSFGVTQLKEATFLKMGIVDNFPDYGKKHIKKKVEKEVNEAHSSASKP